MRRTYLIALLTFALSVAFAAEAEPAHEIEISADVPTITVAPRRTERHTMRLPSLTYALSLVADCDENWQPDSVSISVADSTVSFDAEQLQVKEALEFELRVPSNQIAPLRIEKFCINDEVGTADQDRLTIPSILSAQASLRCRTESAQSMRYVTKPLDVMLECEVPEPAED